MGWNLDLPKVVASLHANLSEVIPKMEFIIIASKRQLPKRQPIIASRPDLPLAFFFTRFPFGCFLEDPPSPFELRDFIRDLLFLL